MSEQDSKFSRRDLLKGATLAGAGLTAAHLNKALAEPQRKSDTMIGVRFEPLKTVRVGIIGVGGRGMSHLRELLAVENVQITAICDLVQAKCEKARDRVEQAGQKAPALYHGGERDFEKLCRRDDVDLVYVVTPWDWHVPMAVAAMKNGKHAATEVPAAPTLTECWELVETSEQTRRHCVMLENCCYGQSEMMALSMVRDGVFGELLHGEAAYLHDLRDELFSKEGEGLWRRFTHLNRNGNLYPTHGLGPVANYMGVNRGDRFDYLVSMSSPQMGLDAYRAANLPKDDPRWSEKYTCGDLNTTLIKTARGRTIMLQHDVSNPRVYSRINSIAGTKGLFCDYPARVYLDKQPGGERWGTLDKYKEKYEHPLWKQFGDLARKSGGHGGMDYIMNYRLIQCIREGLVPDMDVYDAAAWSAPAPLSEISVAQGSAPVKFPDFTRGRWMDERGGV